MSEPTGSQGSQDSAGRPGWFPVRGRAPRPMSKRTLQVVCLLFIVAGLGMACGSGWTLAGALGPTTTTSAHIVDLSYTPGGRHLSPTYDVEVAWDGGQEAVDSEYLYDALDPLEGQPAVEVERSTVTGSVLQVELGGRWYPAPGSDVLGASLFGLLGLFGAAFFAFFFVRVGRRAPAT